MEMTIHVALNRYFKHLTQMGYQNYGTVAKLLFLLHVDQCLNDPDMAMMFTECDMQRILRVLYKVFGSECIIPFPYE